MTEPLQSSGDELTPESCGRISVPQITKRLKSGRLGVYAMLEQGIIPAVRLGRRWIITRRAYVAWKETCGVRTAAGLPPSTRANGVN